MIWLALIAVSYVVKRVAHHYFTLQMRVSAADMTRHFVVDALLNNVVNTVNEGRAGTMWVASLLFFGEGPPLHVRLSHGLEDFAERLAARIYNL